MYETLQRSPWERVTPSVDDVDFKSLYTKSHYDVRTPDGWTLVVTRYRPVRQPFPQPVFMEPMLLVHGFSQNRHTWTSGEFVKNLLFFGVDIHIVELRGHGLSSIELQEKRARLSGRPPPADLDYGWDIDSYFLQDLPATIERMKREVGREEIFYCGHSMGGMLGYGLAGLREDLEGLVTIGAASELGKGFFGLKLLGLAEPILAPALDGALHALNLERRTRFLLEKGARISHQTLRQKRLGSLRLPVFEQPGLLSYRFAPMDEILGWLESQLAPGAGGRYRWIAPLLMTFLANPERATVEDVRWLLREGAEKEPRRVIEQFARWIRKGELICFRTGYRFKEHYPKIDIPMAIIFGDMDRLASIRSTAAVYRAAKSQYLLWRPVKGNSHIELTMGHDIRQICYDIKNLIEFAATHRHKAPSLPRIE